MKKWSFGISASMVLVAAFLLISGSELLLIRIHEPSNLPVGTITTWLGLMALPIVFLTSSELLWKRKLHGRIYGILLLICLLLGTSWGFISYGLSGKWNFTFSGSSPTFVGSAEAGEVFWLMTYVITAIPVIVFLFFSVHSLVQYSLKSSNST